ncbi:hypothetical protein SCP_0901220 [Sparassis crispa]|uniref:Uncharacterized protein n=1 Tax=Sparassis crispa TaxID=139825 RepID=A0A401GVN1_9APHY|nr:hypothetical protein SCP_0901220 [Sparassis crispa]GBE86243.1 hypothetical protein SCP_0901220 [Sparassis crispa]
MSLPISTSEHMNSWPVDPSPMFSRFSLLFITHPTSHEANAMGVVPQYTDVDTSDEVSDNVGLGDEETLGFLAEEETDASTIPRRCPSLPCLGPIELPEISYDSQYECPELAPLNICLVALPESTSCNDVISAPSDCSDRIYQPIVKFCLPELLHSDWHSRL